jgi:heme/copper-type cytochrome/quinol oxidase subunit 4
MREDPRHFAQEAKRRERRAWAYLWFTSVMIVVIVVAFLWWTW